MRQIKKHINNYEYWLNSSQKEDAYETIKYLPDDVLHHFMKGLDSYKDEKDSIAQEKMRKGAWN